MAQSRLRCQGCNKVFSYHGLTLHIAKTERPLCRAVNAALQTPTILQSFAIAGHPLVPDLNPVPPGPSGAFLGNGTSPVSGVRQSSCEIAGADHGNVLWPCRDSSTNTYISDDNMNDPEDGINGVLDPEDSINGILDTVDAADSLDADAYEHLTDGVTVSNVVIPEGVPPIEQGEAEQPPPDPLIQVDEPNSEPMSELVITHFPTGSPGAPIPDVNQGSTMHQARRAAPDSSNWAPFCSKLDWEIACWAKTRGPTSSALTELLGIPEVCGLFLALMCTDNLLICHVGR